MEIPVNKELILNSFSLCLVSKMASKILTQDEVSQLVGEFLGILETTIKNPNEVQLFVMEMFGANIESYLSGIKEVLDTYVKSIDEFRKLNG